MKKVKVKVMSKSCYSPFHSLAHMLEEPNNMGIIRIYPEDKVVIINVNSNDMSKKPLIIEENIHELIQKTYIDLPPEFDPCRSDEYSRIIAFNIYEDIQKCDTTLDALREIRKYSNLLANSMREIDFNNDFYRKLEYVVNVILNTIAGFAPEFINNSYLNDIQISIKASNGWTINGGCFDEG